MKPAEAMTAVRGLTADLDNRPDFAAFIEERFGGTLRPGSHNPNGAACFHEALNVYQGKDWSDSTDGTLNLIPINDAPWSSDEARTEAMVPLGPLVLAWPSWTRERQQAWAKFVAGGVIRRILPPMLRAVAARIPANAPELVAAALRCESEGSVTAAWSAWSAASAAWSAWSAARSAAAWSAAAWSAASAARSAESAAWSAAWSDDAPLRELCRIMLEAEEATR